MWLFLDVVIYVFRIHSDENDCYFKKHDHKVTFYLLCKITGDFSLVSDKIIDVVIFLQKNKGHSY